MTSSSMEGPFPEEARGARRQVRADKRAGGEACEEVRSKCRICVQPRLRHAPRAAGAADEMICWLVDERALVVVRVEQDLVGLPVVKITDEYVGRPIAIDIAYGERKRLRCSRIEAAT